MALFFGWCKIELNHLIPGEVLYFDPPIAVDFTGRHPLCDFPPLIFKNPAFESDPKSYREKINGCKDSGSKIPLIATSKPSLPRRTEIFLLQVTIFELYRGFIAIRYS